MSIPNSFKEHFQKRWKEWGVGSAIVALIFYAALITAQDWVEKETEKFLASNNGQHAISTIMEDTYKNAIGASYSAHFVLGKKKNAFEYYSLPIYVTDDRPTYLYLEMADSGADDPVKIELSVEDIKVDYALSGSSPPKVINLTSYIAEVKKKGVSNFNENIVTVSFRTDPTQETSNIVSVKVLINVHGLPIMGK